MAEEGTKEVIKEVVTEEVKDATGSVIDGEKDTETTQESTAPAELSATEQLAISQGWVPLDKWEGDPRDHRGAKEFVDRGELLGTIRSTRQELQKVQQLAAQLSEHNKKVFEAGYQNAIKELRTARAAAIENADGKAVNLIDEQIDANKERLAALKTEAPNPQGTQGPSADFQLFLQRNPQYLSESTYRHWAHGMALDFKKVNPQASEGDVYYFIEQEAKKTWPDKYGNQRKAPPSPDGQGRGTSTKTTTAAGGSKAFDALMTELPEDQVRMAKDMVKRGYMTKEKYVEDYNSIGGR